MDWNALIFAILTTVISTILSLSFALLRNWLISKIKDDKARKLILEINDIVVKYVKYVYQTYVEELKEKNAFSKENQKIALEKCKTLITNEFSNEMKDYITENYVDVSSFVLDKIEATIYDLKGGNK